jgi:uncharacterized protein YprB with RNaseH-like and TPR domain
LVISNLTKDEYLKRSRFRCKCGHNGLEHPNCYLRANLKDVERVGFFDIEASSLTEFGIVLSYCIKEEGGRIYKRVLTPREIREGIYDKELLTQFCKDCRSFTRLIGYYSTKYDTCYLRMRCEYYKLPFPVFKEILHTDAYQVVKHKFGTFHSRRLGVACDFFGIKAKQHPLSPTIWVKCLSGDKRALDYVLSHNIEDVVSLEKLWHRIAKYTKLTKTSI